MWGNRELLAVKMALQEWRHWLEGAEHQFIVWTDHKNLENLRTAKCLNSRQARWPCCLSGSTFPSPTGQGPRTSSQMPFLAAITGNRSGRHSGPSRTLITGCLCLTLSVPRSWSRPIPPGLPVTRVLVRPWPSCPNAFGGLLWFWMLPHLSPSARSAHRTRLLGKLRRIFSNHCLSLTVPGSLDFITGLPPSEDNSAILTVVDRFSKAAHFIPLPKLPSVKETVQLMVQHVFRIHGLPVDMVSDRGRQFSSWFRKAFCTLIGSSASLSSGFHPQSNIQSERANQDSLVPNLRQPYHLESATGMGCVHPQHPSLLCHGSLALRVFLGISASALPEQEEEVSNPSAQMFIRRCHSTWKRAWAALLKTTSRDS
ncbi:uncharacterized protein LOC120048251 isoform X2 [Salvelinus namaycush]|uniref:Uncharacterized protein LOC120048251 isoform X2 n=1 Tax=Salvelinus namaycush TaxID=8040 RepID=A0A8U0QV36_SALNM|nr:uncharacterized protein LOC120048251 isoform X2 [Salvelinus namaycush]